MPFNGRTRHAQRLPAGGGGVPHAHWRPPLPLRRKEGGRRPPAAAARWSWRRRGGRCWPPCGARVPPTCPACCTGCATPVSAARPGAAAWQLAEPRGQARMAGGGPVGVAGLRRAPPGRAAFGVVAWLPRPVTVLAPSGPGACPLLGPGRRRACEALGGWWDVPGLGLRGAVPGLGRSSPWACVRFCRWHKADRARAGYGAPWPGRGGCGGAGGPAGVGCGAREAGQPG